jgi:hypothetical protein
MIYRQTAVSIDPNLTTPAARQQLINSFLTAVSANRKSETTYDAAGAVIIFDGPEVTTVKHLAGRVLDKCHSMVFEQFARDVIIETAHICRRLPGAEAEALKIAVFFDEYKEYAPFCAEAVREAHEALYG